MTTKTDTIKTNTINAASGNTTEMMIVTGITTQVVNIPQGDEMSWKLFRGGTPEVVRGNKIENADGKASWLGVAKDVDEELGGVVHHLKQSEIVCQEGVDVYLRWRESVEVLAERNTVIDALTAQVDEQQETN